MTLGRAISQCHAPGFRHGLIRVVSDRRIDFDRNVTVYSTSAVVYGAKDVASPAHVIADHRTSGFLGGDTSQRQVMDLAVVLRAACQRPLEDRGIGGDPDDVAIAHESGESATAQPFAVEAVQPDGYAVI
jgi:hypothetical protein